MKRLTRLAMPLMLALILVTGASAATIDFFSSFNTFSNAPQNVNVNFDLFGPGNIPVGSTINSLTVDLISGSLVSSATATNNDTLAGTTFTFNLDGFQLTITVPSFTAATLAGANRNENISVGPAPGPGNVASFGNTSTPLTNSFGTTATGDCMDGVCTYVINKDAEASVNSDNGLFTFGVTTQATGTLRFRYDYTPNEDPDPDPIPEPTTILLVGGALLGLGLFRRR